MLNINSQNPLIKVTSVHVAEKLRLKEILERSQLKPIEFSNYEMIFQFESDSYAFVYNYGSIVFFNVSENQQESELAKITENRTQKEHNRATDIFYVQVDKTEPTSGNNKVYFDKVVVHTLSFEVVKIICMLLAESTALEYYENLIENLMLKTNKYSKTLRRQGKMLESTEDLIKFIGLCLDTKQEIISNLYIVDSPDETWESVELDKLHQDLKFMFEIDTRYRALEYKIKIVQESVDVIVDLSKSKRDTLLEIIIILLLVVEIILSILKWGA